jgi:hypothetical protein
MNGRLTMGSKRQLTILKTKQKQKKKQNPEPSKTREKVSFRYTVENAGFVFTSYPP